MGASAYGVAPDTVVAYRAMVVEQKPDGDDDHDAQRHPGATRGLGARYLATRDPPDGVGSGSVSQPPTDRRDSRSRTICAISRPSRSLPLI